MAANYLFGWFGIDFVASFPWDTVLESTELGGSKQGVQYTAMVRMLRLIRILRILRLGRIVDRLSTFLRMRSAFIKIVQLVFQLVLVVHLLACFFCE